MLTVSNCDQFAGLQHLPGNGHALESDRSLSTLNVKRDTKAKKGRIIVNNSKLAEVATAKSA